MTVRIKNWHKFQHFKDRRPPWVKLYRDLLDDMEWHELEPKAAKALVTLWLIASESDGELPETKKLSFRMRLPEMDVLDVFSKLSHWLEHYDDDAISTRHRADINMKALTRSRETEAEKRREETEGVCEDFERFWSAYPKRKSKGQAEKTWAKIKPDAETVEAILNGIEAAKSGDLWQREDGRFIPHPATWLNAKGWLDSYEPCRSAAADWWIKAGFGTKEAAQRSGVREPA